MKELEAFLTHLKQQDLAQSTLDNYRVNLRLFAKWFQDTTEQEAAAATVTPLDIRQYRAWCKGKFKPSTTNHKLVYLRGFYKWAVATGAAASDPTAQFKLVDRGRARPKWLTRQEQYKLLRQVQQHIQLAQVNKLDFTARIATRTAAIVVVLLNTGLRVSELAKLRVKDLEMSERGGKLTVRYGKGGKFREIPLNVDARRALRAWLDARQVNSDYVFTSDEGQPITRQIHQWHLAKLGDKTGLHLHPHKLRHTFAKNLVDAGVQLDRVAALMGHNDLSTTAIYTQPGWTDLEGEVKKIQWGDE